MYCRALPILIPALLVTACNTQPAETGAAPTTGQSASLNTAEPNGNEIAPNASEPTIGGDGSQIMLSPLSATEIGAAKLQGELGCSFTGSSGDMILIAKGNVGSNDPAFGVVKVGDYVEQVATPGGYDAMIDGATFGGKGKTIRIALTGPAMGGGESPPRPATLTYDRMDGAQRSFAGQWTCGP